MGRNQYWAGRVYDLCVYYMTGTPEGSTESGFMEKPGFEPATPGLQGIALIHGGFSKSIKMMINKEKLQQKPDLFHTRSAYYKYYLSSFFMHSLYLRKLPRSNSKSICRG